MKNKIFLMAAAVLIALSASLWAADVAGKWIANAPSSQGNVDITLDFKVDGEKITGTLDNPDVGPADIKDGIVKGDEISFHVVREFGGNELKIVWKGKISGDEIKFVRTVEGMEAFGGPGGAGGPGGGAPPSPEIIAKRIK
jgi:hypothetical protein